MKGRLLAIKEMNVATWAQSSGADQSMNVAYNFTYDASGNLKTATQPSGVVTTYVNTSAGGVADAYDPLNIRRHYAYDALGRVVAESVYTAPQTNPYGINSLSVCNSSWFSCSFAQTAVNAGIPSLIVTNYHYTPVGVDSIIDAARGVGRAWRYDARGNVVAAVDDYNHAARQFFATSGLLDSTVSRGGMPVQYAHDAMGRIVKRTYPWRGYSYDGDVYGDSTKYIYDQLSRATTLINNWDTTRMAYYADGSVATEVHREWGYDSLAYRYDAAGRRTLRLHQDGAGVVDSVRYTYNGFGDLDSLIARWGAPAGFTAPRVFRFTWDALGRRKTIHYPTSGALDVTYYYDILGTLRGVQALHPSDPASGNDVFDVQLRRPLVQPDGRVRREQLICGHAGFAGAPCGSSSPVTHDFRYNVLGWLVRDSSGNEATAMTYDASGNMVWRQVGAMTPDSFLVDAGHNRVVKVTTGTQAALTISYNDDGSRTSEYRDSTSEPGRKYFYDGLGRPSGLMTVTTINGINELFGFPMSCVYDPLGRQVTACAGNTVLLGLDGESIVRAGNWGIASGPGLDDPLVGIARGSGVLNRELYYITDGQGRHLAAGENDGSIAGDIVNGATQYDGWQATGAAGGTAYGADRLSRPQAPGLAFYRNRIYDQSTGRWTQEDPLGVAGGLNLYQFNGNDPVTFTDPFGLKVCFRGNTSAENAKLKEAAEQATDTKIQVDSRNCVKKVTFQGKSNEALAVLADYFMNLVKSDDLYTVKFTPEADSPQWNPRVINIAYTAEGLAYATKVNGKCLDDQFAHSFPQVFAHELFHHRTVPFTGKMDDNENNSVAAENVYNDFAGRPRRCKY